MNTILVVDDHPLVRTGLRLLIQMNHPACEIVEAGSFDTARPLLMDRDFDLVFLDLDLQSAHNGLELLSAARASGVRSRIVILSAGDDRATVTKCIQAGASGFLTKGLSDEKEFSRALSAILDHRVHLPASVLPDEAGSYRLPLPVDLSFIDNDPVMRDVLYFLCQGFHDDFIAMQVDETPSAVRKNHISVLLRHFGVARRSDLLIQMARQSIKVKAPWED